MERRDRERPPVELPEIDWGEFDVPPVSPLGEEEEIPWWESYPQTPAPPVRPSEAAPSSGGYQPGAPAFDRPPEQTGAGIGPATAMAISGSRRPSARGPSYITLRKAKWEEQHQKLMETRRRAEAGKRQREQEKKRRKAEKERLKAMEKLQEKNLELRKLAILKPAWGI